MRLLSFEGIKRGFKHCLVTYGFIFLAFSALNKTVLTIMAANTQTSITHQASHIDHPDAVRAWPITISREELIELFKYKNELTISELSKISDSPIEVENVKKNLHELNHVLEDQINIMFSLWSLFTVSTIWLAITLGTVLFLRSTAELIHKFRNTDNSEKLKVLATKLYYNPVIIFFILLTINFIINNPFS